MEPYTILWIIICLVVPPAWGWAVYRLFISLRLHRWLPGPKPAPLDRGEATSTWDYQI
jgi:hypothetical protein